MRKLHQSVALISVLFVIDATLTTRHSALKADEATAKFYDQLRQRRLFSLVESDCLRRLAAKSLGPRERSEVTLELSRTYAAHAWHTIGTEQEDLWQRATRTIVEYLDRTKPAPRRELFDLQLALIDLGRAEWDLAQSELRPEDREPRERGLSAAQTALERLSVLEKTLGQQVRQNSSETSSGSRPVAKEDAAERLSPFERRALWQQARFRLGIGKLTQARLVEPNSADRASALIAAEEWLLPLAGGPAGERLTMESQLALAEVARCRGDLDRAAKLLSTFEKTISEDVPFDLRERFVIERLRGMLAKRQSMEAAEWLSEQRRVGVLKPNSANTAAATSPELNYWQIVVELAARQRAEERGDRKRADELWNRLSAEVSRLGQEETGYWAARAKLDWQREREVRQYGRELASLVRKARSSFSTSSADEAIRRFDEAIAAARSSGSEYDVASLLLELRDTRATLLFQAQRFDEAAAAFRELALAPRYERSAATHLLWAYCLGKQFEKETTDDRRKEFVDTLQSLRERYPKQPESAEASWLLGQVLERQQRFAEAIEMFASIPPKHARYDEAWASIARCHEQQLAQLRQEGKATADAEEFAIRQLLPIAMAALKDLDSSKSRPERSAVNDDDVNEVAKSQASMRGVSLSKPRAELLTRLARLLLEKQPADDKTGDQLLEVVISRSRDDDWQHLAKQLRVVSLAGQRRIDEAEKLIASLESSGADELLALLDGLTAVASRGDLATQRMVAELELRASGTLVDSQAKLSDQQRLRLWRARAEAFAATGQPTKAITVYQQLVEKSPRDPKLLRTAAELCESLGSKDANRQAKTYWRRLEGMMKAGSSEWFDARWHVIHVCRNLGENDEADKLLKVTKLLYPDLGGDAMQARFAELAH